MYMENVKKYHKLFSFWSVNVLAVHKIKADWSVRDRNLVQLIASISKSCSMLAEVSHNCTFFLQLQTSSIENSFQPINIDRNGRKVVMHNEHKICSDYNSLKKFRRNNCSFIHVCNLCKNKDHLLPTWYLKSKSKYAASLTTKHRLLSVRATPWSTLT